MKRIRNISILLIAVAAAILSACGGSGTEAELTLSVQPATLSFEASASSSAVSVSSNSSWTVTPGADWLSVNPSSGSGDGNVTVSVPANTGNMRSATVTFTAKGAGSKQISVTQMNAGETGLVPIQSESDGTKRASTTYQLLVYSFALIFMLVSITMVCSKAFAQEKTDIGIYKSIGLTSLRLRGQFSLRYFFVALIGCIIGMLPGMAFGVRVIEMIFKLFGISRLKTSGTPLTYIGAVAFISISVAAFSFIISRKVKKIEVRELITE